VLYILRMPIATGFDALLRFGLSVSRATTRALRAPRLQVRRVERAQILGSYGAHSVELSGRGRGVELYTLDGDGLATWRGYAPPALATQARAVWS
jgi:hypothetical protein